MDNCSGCGKNMLDKDGDSMACMVIHPYSEKDSVCAALQMGDYLLEPPYAICFECVLKAFKVHKP